MKSSPHAHSHGVRSTTLVLALSIHSIIEGIALGVGVCCFINIFTYHLQDNASETTALFLSLMVHKLIVAFSVGLQLSRTHAHQYKLVSFKKIFSMLFIYLGRCFDGHFSNNDAYWSSYWNGCSICGWSKFSKRYNANYTARSCCRNLPLCHLLRGLSYFFLNTIIPGSSSWTW